MSSDTAAQLNRAMKLQWDRVNAPERRWRSRDGNYEIWFNGGYSGPGGDGPEWAGTYRSDRIFSMAADRREAVTICNGHASALAAQEDGR